jgi:hypothetical protein
LAFCRAGKLSCWVVALALFARDAAADDLTAKQACVATHEQAQRLRHDGHLVAARAALAACSESSCPTLVRTDCAQWLVEVDDTLPTIVLAARDASGTDVTDVRVTCDGQEIATRLDGRAVPVDPGEHVIRFEHGSSPLVDTRIVVREGERARPIVAQFEATAAPLAAQSTGPSTATYVVGGLAVAALGSFAFFGIRGLSDESDLSSTCSPHCTDAEVHGTRTDFIVADVSLGAGLALGAAATWLFFSTRKPVDPLPVALSIRRDIAGQRQISLDWSLRLP